MIYANLIIKKGEYLIKDILPNKTKEKDYA